MLSIFSTMLISTLRTTTCPSFPITKVRHQIPPYGSLGLIQHTIGSPRFLQLQMHLVF